MLATVADDEMPASDLCFEILAGDPRFGLADLPESEPVHAESRSAAHGATAGVSPEQREARRQKKQRDAEERRKKMEAARKAGEQLRRERKKETLGAAGRSPAPKDQAPAAATWRPG